MTLCSIHNPPLKCRDPYTADQCWACWRLQFVKFFRKGAGLPLTGEEKYDRTPEHAKQATRKQADLPTLPYLGYNIKPPCPYLGERLPSPCGAALHRCNYDGTTCVASGQCDDANKYRQCRECEYHPLSLKAKPERVIIEQGACGMGDGLLGLLATTGFKCEHPQTHVHYKVSDGAAQWVRPFHGYDTLTGDAECHNEKRVAGAFQLNMYYGFELRTKFRASRIQRYCHNCGTKTPVVPPLREPDRIRALGEDYRGAILLCPFSTNRHREYARPGWLTLERQLQTEYRTVLVHGDTSRTDPFRSEKMIGQPAELVIAAFLNAAAVVACDSGPAHLGALLGRPTIVLSGPTPARQIFGAYGDHVRCLEGELACSGCSFHAPYSDECGDRCPSINSISPARIAGEIAKLVG